MTLAAVAPQSVNLRRPLSEEVASASRGSVGASAFSTRAVILGPHRHERGWPWMTNPFLIGPLRATRRTGPYIEASQRADDGLLFPLRAILASRMFSRRVIQRLTSQL